MRACCIHNEVHPTRCPRGGSSQRRGGKAGPPSRLRQPTHDKEIRDPLSACEREGEAASLVDQVWRARSPWQHPHLPTALPLGTGLALPQKERDAHAERDHVLDSVAEVGPNYTLLRITNFFRYD